MSLHRPSAPGRWVMPMKRPVGALSLLADPEILSIFDTNRAVMRETRQTRIENHTYLDAPVFAAHFTVPAAGYFESRQGGATLRPWRRERGQQGGPVIGRAYLPMRPSPGSP